MFLNEIAAPGLLALFARDRLPECLGSCPALSVLACTGFQHDLACSTKHHAPTLEHSRRQTVTATTVTGQLACFALGCCHGTRTTLEHRERQVTWAQTRIGRSLSNSAEVLRHPAATHTPTLEHNVRQQRHDLLLPELPIEGLVIVKCH